MVTILGDRRRIQLEERLAWGPAYQDSGHIFTKENGSPLHPDETSKRFNRLVALAEVPRIRFHDVRHTWATMVWQLGCIRRSSPSAWAWVDPNHSRYVQPCHASAGSGSWRVGGEPLSIRHDLRGPDMAENSLTDYLGLPEVFELRINLSDYPEAPAASSTRFGWSLSNRPNNGVRRQGSKPRCSEPSRAATMLDPPSSLTTRGRHTNGEPPYSTESSS